jgi:hypothetical protein
MLMVATTLSPKGNVQLSEVHFVGVIVIVMHMTSEPKGKETQEVVLVRQVLKVGNWRT